MGSGQRRSVLFAQLLALGGAGGCRAAIASPTDAASGAVRPQATVVSAQECQQRAPTNRGCAAAGERCSGQRSDCARAPQGVPPRCSQTAWACTCEVAPRGGLAWRCDMQLHPAGPQPPPELA